MDMPGPKRQRWGIGALNSILEVRSNEKNQPMAEWRPAHRALLVDLAGAAMCMAGTIFSLLPRASSTFCAEDQMIISGTFQVGHNPATRCPGDTVVELLRQEDSLVEATWTGMHDKDFHSFGQYSACLQSNYAEGFAKTAIQGRQCSRQQSFWGAGAVSLPRLRRHPRVPGLTSPQSCRMLNLRKAAAGPFGVLQRLLLAGRSAQGKGKGQLRILFEQSRDFKDKRRGDIFSMNYAGLF